MRKSKMEVLEAKIKEISALVDKADSVAYCAELETKLNALSNETASEWPHSMWQYFKYVMNQVETKAESLRPCGGETIMKKMEVLEAKIKEIIGLLDKADSVAYCTGLESQLTELKSSGSYGLSYQWPEVMRTYFTYAKNQVQAKAKTIYEKPNHQACGWTL
jgi:hypothetical protein